VEGFDAAAKVVILANLLLGAKLSLKDVQRKGITQLSQTEIAEAQRAGQRWKLIGSINKEGEKVLASVQPMCLPLTHPLAHVSGAMNAITYTTELLGERYSYWPGRRPFGNRLCACTRPASHRQ
jgi:homoserine dehydrogenase